MRMSELIGERYKEKPADCTIESHALMVRGGYIKQVNTGVYTLLPPARRITHKIERIIREEMDAIGETGSALPRRAARRALEGERPLHERRQGVGPPDGPAGRRHGASA